MSNPHHISESDDSKQSGELSWEVIQKRDFLAQVSLFTQLTEEQISHYALKIDERAIAAGTLIFNEGDLGDECYLIKEGKVEISTKKNSEDRKSIAILESSMIFGELALLSDDPRSASATMIEDGALLVIKKDLFQELLQAHVNVAESIVSLAMERAHPMHAEEVFIFHRTSTEGEEISILKHSTLKKYYQLSPLGLFVWEHLNGEMSIQEVILQVLQKYGASATNKAYNIIFDLWELNFLYFPSLLNFLSSQQPLPKVITTPSGLAYLKQRLRKIFIIKKIFPDIDADITRIYSKYIKNAFTPFTLKTIKLLTYSGLILLPILIYLTITSTKPINHPVILLLAVYTTHLLTVIPHELAHAFTTKSFGREVHSAGIIFYWVGLFAYVDTTDMWLSNKKSRITVDLAGPAMDLCIASAAIFLGLFISSPFISFFFLAVALLLYFDVSINLTPMAENDGYHALSSHMRNPKLMNQSDEFLKIIFRNPKNAAYLIKTHHNETIYWSACLLGTIVSTLIAFAGQLLIQKIVPETFMGISSSYLLWFLPALVLISFALKVTFRVKNNKQ